MFHNQSQVSHIYSENVHWAFHTYMLVELQLRITNQDFIYFIVIQQFLGQNPDLKKKDCLCSQQSEWLFKWNNHCSYIVVITVAICLHMVKDAIKQYPLEISPSKNVIYNLTNFIHVLSWRLVSTQPWLFYCTSDNKLN